MKTVALGDIVEEFRYGTSNKSKPHGEPTLRIPNVVSGAIDTVELKTVPVDASEFERLRLATGDLLFVRSNGNPANVGRCAVFEPAQVTETGYPSDRFIYASYLIRARLRRDQVEPAFVARYLSTGDGRRALIKNAKTSAGQFNINIAGLSAVTIPLPSIDEQRRIARILDQADAIRAKRRQVLAHLNSLTHSIFQKAVSGVQNRRNLHDMGVDFLSGKNVLGGDMDAHPSNRVIKVSAMSRGSFDPSESKPMPNGYTPPASHRIRHGDILFGRASGSLDLLGATAVVDVEPHDLYLPDKVWRLTIKSNAEVEPHFILGVLRSPEARSFIRHNASGAAGVRNIAKSRLLEYEAPYPPLDSQREFVTQAEQVNTQTVLVQRALDADNEVFASLQVQAFRGEL